MTQEEFYTYQEQTFDSYVKKVIRNEGKNARKELSRCAQRNIPLSSLPDEALTRLSSEDVYHLEESMTFFVRGEMITVHDLILGQALASLPPKRRDVILLYYFLGQTDPQIGARLNLDPSTIRYRRKTGLQRLKAILEELDDGK